ncbi:MULTISPECIES: MbtH family NRPS accessory protein [Peribacillus]|uniref:MbtH family NRPS accessory protein n=1 Tax=Peribacillus TaxID=2675229 RepID=UPI00399FDEDE
MTNLFVNETGIYNGFINEEGRHSLWPAFLVIPEGWSLIYREDCWKYKKLVASIDGTK